MLVLLVERTTGRNLFAFLGGVPEITDIRDGRMRCQGAFAHPILAGTYWAVSVPLMLLLISSDIRFRITAVLGVFSALTAIILCASSGPVIAVIAGLMVISLFAIRNHSRLLIACCFVLATILHFSMDKPIWHLISRISVVGGSTGYHRFQLIDRFLAGADRWIWTGTSDTSFLADFRGIADITNQYILEALRGGLATLLVLLAAIAIATLAGLRAVDAQKNSREKAWLSWCVLASFAVHLVSFLSVSYFGQITIIWMLTLAMLGSLKEWGQITESDDCTGSELDVLDSVRENES